MQEVMENRENCPHNDRALRAVVHLEQSNYLLVSEQFAFIDLVVKF